MPIRPKHSIEKINADYRNNDEFTDREEFIKVFIKNLTYNKKYQHNVLVYYGIGGIGKTTLRKKLCEILNNEYKDTIWSIVDFDSPAHREEETALFLLRREFWRKYKIKFHSFDIAYSIYWKKTHPHKPFNKETFRLLEESETLSELVGVLSHIHIIGVIPRLTFFLAESKHHLNNWWKKRGHKELSILPELEPREILERLPMYFASDLREAVSDSNCVIFLDSYEALWENQLSTGNFFKRDEWVRELIAHLPEPLWIISGRDRLRWSETDESWSEAIKHHSLNEFSFKDSKTFLEKCSIKDKIIHNVIYESSNGVPYYLDLAVDTYFEIKHYQKREPRAEDFAKTQNEVTERLLKYMDSQKIETLKVLSCTNFWDAGIFKHLVNKFKTGYPITAMKELCNYSFINHNETSGNYTMHNMMRKGLISLMDDWLIKETHQSIFEYYFKKLEDLNIKNITDENFNSFREAFYHKTKCSNADELFGWFYPASRPFRKSGHWNYLVPIYEVLLNILEIQKGKINVNYITSFNDLSLSAWRNGDHEKAIEYNEELLKYQKMLTGELNADYASYINNRAVFYYSLKNYEKSIELQEKSLEIRIKTLGENNPEVAKSLDNLALVYNETGNFTKAVSLQEKAAAIFENDPNTDKILYAQLLHNLGVTNFYLKDFDKALKFYNRSLELKKSEYGENNVTLAITHENLAHLYYNIHDYRNALINSRKAQSIFDKIYGQVHINSRTNLEIMKKILKKLNIPEEIKELEERLKKFEYV